MSPNGHDDRHLDDSLEERRARPPEARTTELPFEDLAFHDDLTGLLNRRFVNRLIADDWQQFITRYAEVSFVLIDLDGFKAVNDVYGHHAGDEVLRVVARLLRQNFRDAGF